MPSLGKRVRQRRAVRIIAWITGVLFAALFLVTAIVVRSPAFEDVWRDFAARAIALSFNRPITINGDVKIRLSDPMTVRMTDVWFGDVAGSKNQGGRKWKWVEFSISVGELLSGNFEISGLAMSGARFEISDEVEEERPSGDDSWRSVLARMPSKFLNANVSDNFEFRDIVVNLGDKDAGWAFKLVVEVFSSKRKVDGQGIALELRGTINDLPVSMSGHYANPRLLSRQGVGGPFNLAASLDSLKVDISGTLDISDPVASIEAQAAIRSDSLADVLKIFRITHEGDGDGEFTARLSGLLDTVRLNQIDLKINDRHGRSLAVRGEISNLGTGEGVDLAFVADLRRGLKTREQPASVFEIGVAGIKGQISGFLDRLEVERIFVSTNVASAELRNIGPITLGRIVRDADGQLGFLDFRILDGPEDNPAFDISGSITDVLGLSGINFAGLFDIAISEVLMPDPGPQSDDLGRLQGRLAASDAGGSLRLTEFVANSVGTELFALSIHKASPEEVDIERRTFHIELDITDFDSVAERLGHSADVGAVSFAGTLSLGEKGGAAIKGNARVARTEFVLVTESAIRDGAPFFFVSVSSDMLDLTDVERAVQVYRVYSIIDSKDIEVDMDDNFVAETRLELDVNIREIHGVGNNVANLRAIGIYEDGIAELSPLKMNFLEGVIEASVWADTNRKPVALSTMGRIDRLDMRRFLISLGLKPLVTGALNTSFDLSAQGDSRSELLSSLNGTVKAEIWGGSLSSRVIDLGGLNVVRWMFSKSAIPGEATLVCAVATMEFNDGRAAANPIVFETENVQVIGAGDVDIRAGSIDLSFQTRPKRRELVDVATAFTVEGSLTAPEVRVVSGAGAGRFFGEALTAPLNILRLVLPKAGTAKKRQPCVVEETP